MKRVLVALLITSTPAMADQQCLLTSPPQCVEVRHIESNGIDLSAGTVTMSATGTTDLTLPTEPFSIEDAVKGLAMIMHYAEGERELGVKKAMLRAAMHLQACINMARDNSQAVLPEGSC